MSLAEPTIPVISNVTGELAGRRLRDRRRTGPATSARRSGSPTARGTSQSVGVTRFLELGPASGLTASIEHVAARRRARHRLDDAQGPPRADDPAHRAGRAERVAGVQVDWRAACPAGDCSTCRPMRSSGGASGCPAAASGSTDAVGLGLAGTDHALLGAVVESPETGGVVLTGRLSVATHPWLADHAVGGVVLFPGAGFVELAIRAGDEVGCNVVDELMLHAPMVLPAEGVAVQVVVSAADEAGGRVVSIFSRAQTGFGGLDAARRGRARRRGVGTRVRTCRSGRRSARARSTSPTPTRSCPRGVTSTARRSRGLTAMWRRGDEVFAEVAMPASCRPPASACIPRCSTARCTRSC